MGENVYTKIDKDGVTYYQRFLDIAKEHFTLSDKEISLILDVAFFYIKKEVLERREFWIFRLGKLHIREYSKIGNKIEFKNARKYITPVINKFRKIEFRIEIGRCSGAYKRVFEGASKCLNTQYRVVLGIFNLFMYVITEELIEDRVLVIKNFGFFYPFKVYYNTDLSGKPLKKPKIRARVKVKPKRRFLQEANYLWDEIDVDRRVARLLEINNVSRKITGKKNKTKSIRRYVGKRRKSDSEKR